jgi:hypothetical protein
VRRYQIRPRLPLAGRFALTGPSSPPPPKPKRPPHRSLTPSARKLDPLTVAGSDWLERIDAERNLPDLVAPGLHDLYGAA